jgi:2-methylcitrate dehydratase PrpD
MENIAFKPYACGTMAQPFIDCAIRLGERGVTAEQIRAIECNVGEGTVHRLWEPALEKHAPSTAYSAKFSVPYCIAVGVLDGAAGLAQFTEERVADPAVRALAAKVGYRIDPANEYPANYSGHLRTTLENGEVIEIEQPHLRGGRREPLSQAELEAKFFANAAHGGWPEARARKLMDWCGEAFTAPTLAGLAAAGR